MKFVNKGLSNENFEANKVINSASLVAKTTVNIKNKIDAFQEPEKPSAYHPFKSFTKTSSKGC